MYSVRSLNGHSSASGTYCLTINGSRCFLGLDVFNKLLKENTYVSSTQYMLSSDKALRVWHRCAEIRARIVVNLSVKVSAV